MSDSVQCTAAVSSSPLLSIVDFKEAFAMYDKDGDGEISVRELITVMRCLGLNPSESEIVEIMANLDLDGKYKFCLSTSLKMYCWKNRST